MEDRIIRATAKNPKNRYADAREMYEDLKTALDDSRKDEKRYVYKYPENDMEETKALDDEVKKVKAETSKTKKTKTKTKTHTKTHSPKGCVFLFLRVCCKNKNRERGGSGILFFVI